MLLHCLNTPSPHPTTYLFSPPLTRPPSPHPLLLIFPVSGPHPSPNVFFFFWVGGSMPLHAMLNHQGCVHLCVLIIRDRWGCFVFATRSRFPPISLRYQTGMVGWGGGGCKRWAKWRCTSCHDKPRGRRVLVIGLLCQVTDRPLLCHERVALSRPVLMMAFASQIPPPPPPPPTSHAPQSIHPTLHPKQRAALDLKCDCHWLLCRYAP